MVSCRVGIFFQIFEKVGKLPDLVTISHRSSAVTIKYYIRHKSHCSLRIFSRNMFTFTPIFCLLGLIVSLSQIPPSTTSPLHDETISDKYRPLYMDIEWVLQGYDFSFTGFMTELLGLSSALLRMNPSLRLTQSSFRKSFHDIPTNNMSAFLQSMFREEADNFNQLFSRAQPGHDQLVSLDRVVTSRIFPTEWKLENSESSVHLCRDLIDSHMGKHETSTETNAVHRHSQTIIRDGMYVGGDLGRAAAPKARSALECCSACLLQPLCVAWTFTPYETDASLEINNVQDGRHNSLSYHLDDRGCILKGAATDFFVMPESISGKFVKKPDSGIDKVLKRSELPRARILHGTTCYYKNMTHFGKDPNTIVIGRYMVERKFFQGGYNQDEAAVLSCASLMEEVWVPTEWAKQVFHSTMQRMGIQAPSIAVIPEAVDTNLFDPSLYPPRDKFWRCNNSNSFQVDANGDSLSSSHQSIDQKYCYANNDAVFEFLSIFKWEYRKGWDILLKAYWKAFTPSDKVVLRLRTYLPMWERERSRFKENITEAIADFAMKTLGKRLDELAPMVWEQGANASRLQDSATRYDMRDMLQSADAFVLPTRGEGWGLPIAEAMAMSLPTIVTNFSGPSAFATSDNAYLIPVADNVDYDGFAIPDEDELVNLFKKVISDSKLPSSEDETISIASLKGRKARETMQSFSPEFVVAKINERLRALASRRGWDFQ